ncbi:MAG TPA: hypothetical protein VFA71_07150, partial [Terriglobales bacterium]|nr:hypothetical protein [Terriglobales bacterium]
MPKSSLSCLALVLLSLMMVSSSYAQVATGFPPFSTIDGAHFDKINLANLNIHFDPPVINKAGRGLGFQYALHFDNSIWFPAVLGPGMLPQWQVIDNSFGWRQHTDVLAGYVTYERGGICIPSYGNWVYHDPAGTAHSFDNSWVGSDCHGGVVSSSSGKATDGSGYQLTVTNAPSATVYPPSGGSIIPPVSAGSFEFNGGVGPLQPMTTGPAQIIDANGNSISTGDGLSFTDTTGANVLTIDSSYSNYTYQTPAGSKSVVVGYTPYYIRTNFGCSGIAEYGPDTGQTQPISLVTSITYPDGSSYQFAYEDTPGYPGNKTGRIASITLPTGGSISYSYWGGDGGLHGIFCDGTTAAFTRTVNDGTNSFQTTYWINQNPPAGGSETHVTAYPEGNETVIDFTDIFETQKQVWQGASGTGTLLETVETCYNGASRPCISQSITSSLITEKTVYPETTYRIAKHDSFFDTSGLGLLTEQDDYDWTSTGTFAPPVRKKLITYANNLGTIMDHPASEIVEDGANPPNILSQVYYYYDQWPLWTPPGTT